MLFSIINRAVEYILHTHFFVAIVTIRSEHFQRYYENRFCPT